MPKAPTRRTDCFSAESVTLGMTCPSRGEGLLPLWIHDGGAYWEHVPRGGREVAAIPTPLSISPTSELVLEFSPDNANRRTTR